MRDLVLKEPTAVTHTELSKITANRAAAASDPRDGASSIEAFAKSRLAAGQAVAVALVVETWGSAPVPAGGMMVVAADDSFRGSVSGGCIEADVIAAAGETLATGRPQVLSFGIENETAWRAGLACGGNIRIAVIRLDPAHGLTCLRRLEDARHDRRALVAAWNLATGALTLHDNSVSQPANIAGALISGASRVVAAEGQEIFLQAFAPPPRIVIVGATHIGQHLSELASAIGYGVRVVDPRAAFTAKDRFNETLAETGWPEALIATASLDPCTAVVTLTHIPAIDDEALASALKSGCRSISALGSRKTHAARLARLSAQGFTEEDLKRIRAPAGLDLGAKTAGEIAVSILAEVIAAFRKG